MVLELCEPLTLREVVAAAMSLQRSYDDRDALGWVRDVAQALHALHTAAPPAIHRDVKAENVLLREPWGAPGSKVSVVLADLGLHVRLEEQRSVMLRRRGVTSVDGGSSPFVAITPASSVVNFPRSSYAGPHPARESSAPAPVTAPLQRCGSKAASQTQSQAPQAHVHTVTPAGLGSTGGGHAEEGKLLLDSRLDLDVFASEYHDEGYLDEGGQLEPPSAPVSLCRSASNRAGTPTGPGSGSLAMLTSGQAVGAAAAALVGPPRIAMRRSHSRPRTGSGTVSLGPGVVGSGALGMASRFAADATAPGALGLGAGAGSDPAGGGPMVHFGMPRRSTSLERGYAERASSLGGKVAQAAAAAVAAFTPGATPGGSEASPAGSGGSAAGSGAAVTPQHAHINPSRFRAEVLGHEVASPGGVPTVAASPPSPRHSGLLLGSALDPPSATLPELEYRPLSRASVLSDIDEAAEAALGEDGRPIASSRAPSKSTNPAPNVVPLRVPPEGGGNGGNDSAYATAGSVCEGSSVAGASFTLPEALMGLRCSNGLGAGRGSAGGLIQSQSVSLPLLTLPIPSTPLASAAAASYNVGRAPAGTSAASLEGAGLQSSTLVRSGTGGSMLAPALSEEADAAAGPALPKANSVPGTGEPRPPTATCILSPEATASHTVTLGEANFSTTSAPLAPGPEQGASATESAGTGTSGVGRSRGGGGGFVTADSSSLGQGQARVLQTAPVVSPFSQAQPSGAGAGPEPGRSGECACGEPYAAHNTSTDRAPTAPAALAGASASPATSLTSPDAVSGPAAVGRAALAMAGVPSSSSVGAALMPAPRSATGTGQQEGPVGVASHRLSRVAEPSAAAQQAIHSSAPTGRRPGTRTLASPGWPGAPRPPSSAAIPVPASQQPHRGASVRDSRPSSSARLPSVMPPGGGAGAGGGGGGGGSSRPGSTASVLSIGALPENSVKSLFSGSNVGSHRHRHGTSSMQLAARMGLGVTAAPMRTQGSAATASTAGGGGAADPDRTTPVGSLAGRRQESAPLPAVNASRAIAVPTGTVVSVSKSRSGAVGDMEARYCSSEEDEDGGRPHSRPAVGWPKSGRHRTSRGGATGDGALTDEVDLSGVGLIPEAIEVSVATVQSLSTHMRRLKSITELINAPKGVLPPHHEHFNWVYNFTGQAGSCCYMAPEVMQKAPYNEKVDTFSLGCLAYELLARELLLVAYVNTSRGAAIGVKMPVDYATKVSEGYRPPRHFRITNDEAWELICACWHQDPCERPGMEEVVARLDDLIDRLGPQPQQSKVKVDGGSTSQFAPHALASSAMQRESEGEGPSCGCGCVIS
ncbi:hypothetical protein HYH03_002609 [Edaphochlamys debaryana]|uniref:Protein kinase domain-containing protein n=1 Tax=Edaphochlamys debaryana TaxID=47281 RepID=A0A836C5B7_9CHLO|nr:hypothetical protein HYH03_002609 [Edaphochlamys debaryana]|eukprot:KAG2499674.1 hypothetical protein HYH03_002609 [Edaphochlamys debaryana]